MKEKKRDWIKTLSVVTAIVAVWFIVARTGAFSAYVFPGPERVIKAFAAMFASGELFKNLLSSLLRVIAGFFISFMLAFLLGIFATEHPKADPFYKPLLEFLSLIPPMSLIPLLILWFGIGETGKIIVIVLTSFFPIFMNTEAGLKNCDAKLLEVGRMMRMSEFEMFTKIRIPYAFPNILVGMRIGLGYSFRALVGAEMIAAASGLGYMILDAQAMSRTDKVIAGILLIGGLGLIIDGIFKLVLRNKNLKW